MTLPRLIGLYSPAPGSGKSTVASYLGANFGFHKVSFAAPLKRMIRTFLLTFGLPAARVDHYVYDAKEELIPELGVTARHLLQTLGTEWGRECVHPSIWLRCWESALTTKQWTDTPVICDDVRFPNEAELIRRFGGELWLIHRPEAIRATEHASEGALDGFVFTRRIVNDGSLIELYGRVAACMTPEREAVTP